MPEGQSQRSVASTAQHRQEAEVAATEERERAAAETVARAARLVMTELAAARAEVEAAVVADAARAAAAELEALCGSSASNFVSANSGTDDELKIPREAAREQAVQWRHPRRPWTHRRCSGRGRVRRPYPRRRRQPRQA
jgi:hypothetical protein